MEYKSNVQCHCHIICVCNILAITSFGITNSWNGYCVQPSCPAQQYFCKRVLKIETIFFFFTTVLYSIVAAYIYIYI